MQSEGRVGVISAGSGSVNPLVTNEMGSLLVAQSAGKYASAVAKGNVYSGANQAGTTWTDELAAIHTGLALTNPTGSGKQLSILSAGLSQRVAAGGAVIQDIWLAGGSHSTAVTHTTPGTPRNMLVGRANSAVGLVDVSCTFPADLTAYLMPLLGSNTAAVLPTSGTVCVVDVDGAIVLQPGSYVAICMFEGGAGSSKMGCIVWEEIDE